MSAPARRVPYVSDDKTPFNLGGFARAQEQAAQISRNLEESRRSNEKALEAIWAAKREKINREIRSVELAEQLVRSQENLAAVQSAMRDIQVSQAAAAGRDRRIQYAVLTVGVLGIVATTILTIAVATQSWLWTLVAGGSVLLIVSALAVLIVRGRKDKSAAD